MKAHIITYGCQMNEYDTHVVESQLVSFGVELVKAVDEADFVLVNTCAVRGKPVEKVKSLLGDLRKAKHQRGLMIGMMGCLAQLDEGQQIARKFEVDVLLGPGALLDIGKALESDKRFWSLAFRDELHEFVAPPPTGRISTHLTIQRGCDHHCTYCIVPETRGPQVSRHPDLIMKELEMLVENGALEVTLLGQNVNSYGKDQTGYPDFGELLRMVGQSGIPRVKFTTSHPMDFSDDIIAAIAETPNVCKYIHLPVQSGSNRVLKLMGREYTREFYIERVQKMRELMPNLFISTDIIVGFPNETEEDFLETVSLYDEIGYDAAFMFIYSARPGTPSYKHFTDMPKEVKTERLGRLVERQKHWSGLRNTALIGRELECLIRGAAYEPSFMEGHTQGNHPILLPVAEAPVPGLYKARIEHATPHMMFGKVTQTIRTSSFVTPAQSGPVISSALMTS
jgi:tRNA-2-methylthio-N6-dimethylallyladenosine synthase